MANPVDPRQTTSTKEPGVRSVYGFSLWNHWLPAIVVTGCPGKGRTPASDRAGETISGGEIRRFASDCSAARSHLTTLQTGEAQFSAGG